jgi:hypothetical protein
LEQELIQKIEKANRFRTLQDNPIFHEFLDDYLNECVNLWAGCKPEDQEILKKAKYEFDLISKQKTRCITIAEEGNVAFKELENIRKEK